MGGTATRVVCTTLCGRTVTAAVAPLHGTGVKELLQARTDTKQSAQGVHNVVRTRRVALNQNRKKHTTPYHDEARKRTTFRTQHTCTDHELVVGNVSIIVFIQVVQHAKHDTCRVIHLAL